MKIKDIKVGKMYRTRRRSWSGGDLVRVIETTHEGQYKWNRTKYPSFICQRLVVDREECSAKDSTGSFGSDKVKLCANQIEREMTIDEFIDVTDAEHKAAHEARRKKDDRYEARKQRAEKFVECCETAGLPQPLAKFDGTVVFYSDQIESFLSEKGLTS